MKNKHAQLINFLLIIIGAVLCMFEISDEENEKYLKILGIIFLMFGLYRATNVFIVSEEERKNAEKEKKEKDA